MSAPRLMLPCSLLLATLSAVAQAGAAPPARGREKSPEVEGRPGAGRRRTDSRAHRRARPGTFHPRSAKVWDRRGHRFVWRDACGNNLPDHQLAGGFEWEGDSRNYIALGEANVRGRRRGGLIMLSFPDGNVLNASWKVTFPKGHVFRISFALTDDAARHSSNGLRFTVVATDHAGAPHVVVERVVKARDRRIYEEEVRLDFAARKITFTHDNLGREMWDVLWILPEGLAVSQPDAPAPPRSPRPAGETQALRLAIEDLILTFGDRYPGGKEFLARLGAAAKSGDAKALSELRREALVANPLVSGQPIAFVVRRQYRSHYHAVDMVFSSDEFNWDRRRMHRESFTGGGAMKSIDLKTGKVKTLAEVPEGVARDPDVHFDGKRIVFAMRKNKLDDYKIYETGADGTGLRQLTFAERVADFDPIYLPDDTIVFSSTREPKYNMCSRDTAANLFRMDADGANIHQITRNTLVDNHASLMPDGRILYARWEYLDRNFGDAHGLWTVNPDGTNQAVYWGNNTAVPAAVFNAHVIPGTQRTLCIFGPHHDRLWGVLGIFDRRLGIDGREPVVRTWPAHVVGTFRAGGPFACDTVVKVRPKYEDPWPLSEKYFLCSRSVGRGEQMGIFVIDVFGNELLLHTEAPGCYDPVPVRPRVRPPVIASRRDFQGEVGYLYVQDIYLGTHMRGVERGSIKYLRVVESPPKKHWSGGSWGGQGYEAPGMNFHSFESKRILGTVPVEPDGSAYFAVPAERFVYFQALDENGMMVQSMRSGTVVQPGERTGCVGCHEDRLVAPPVGRTPRALGRAPSKLDGWYGPPRLFNYATEVQPVFDRHCVRCHDFGKPAGKKLVLAGDRNPYFNASYLELWSKRIITCVGGGPAETRSARSWGSHASRLTKVIRGMHERHKKLKLTSEERDRVITWMDLNGVYYPDYTCAYPDSCSGRSPLDNGQIKRLGKLTRIDFFRAKSHGGNRGPQVSFDRPELSPCLARIKDKQGPQYAEAVAIIRAGQEMLRKRPRVDMPGFVPCEADRKRDAKYALREKAEARSREAIRAGGKVYDEAAR